jgi:hypothetical protein
MRINIDISDESGAAVVTGSPGASGAAGGAPDARSGAAPSAAGEAIDAGPAPTDIEVGATTALSTANTLPASSEGQNAGPAPSLP